MLKFQNFRTLEPDFIDGTATLPVEMYADWLSVLAAENVRRISEAVISYFHLSYICYYKIIS